MCTLTTLACIAAWAADNTLSDKDRAVGWKLLFDGRSLKGWHATQSKGWAVEDGAIAALARGGGSLVTDESFGDFVLSASFREDTDTNSGIFVRRPAKITNGCRGIECQIYAQKHGGASGKHACGAIYDAVAPSKDMCKGPGVWQSMTVYCRDNVIKVTLNGEMVSAMNLDEWKTPGKAPDGSPNKFVVAYKDMPRAGAIALQNHGMRVWFKNIKIRSLDRSEK